MNTRHEQIEIEKGQVHISPDTAFKPGGQYIDLATAVDAEGHYCFNGLPGEDVYKKMYDAFITGNMDYLSADNKEALKELVDEDGYEVACHFYFSQNNVGDWIITSMVEVPYVYRVATGPHIARKMYYTLDAKEAVARVMPGTITHGPGHEGFAGGPCTDFVPCSQEEAVDALRIGMQVRVQREKDHVFIYPEVLGVPA